LKSRSTHDDDFALICAITSATPRACAEPALWVVRSSGRAMSIACSMHSDGVDSTAFAGAELSAAPARAEAPRAATTTLCLREEDM
jgi:hypothetical protein